jgi:hypothetical protein
VLATKQTAVMQVAYLSFVLMAPRNEENDDSVGKEADRSNGCCISSSMKVSGCQDNVDGVANDADSGNECCLPWFWYEGPWLPGR